MIICALSLKSLQMHFIHMFPGSVSLWVPHRVPLPLSIVIILPVFPLHVRVPEVRTMMSWAMVEYSHCMKPQVCIVSIQGA